MDVSNIAIEQQLTPYMTKLSRCGAVDVGCEFPKRNTWLSSFVLNAVVRGAYADHARTYVLHSIRRVNAALDSYALACRSLRGVVNERALRLHHYLSALTQFEASISHVYQVMQSLDKALEKYKGPAEKNGWFSAGDGSDLNRLNDLYNDFRHRLLLGGEQLWISDSGFHSPRAALTFGEFEDVLREWATTTERNAEAVGT